MYACEGTAHKDKRAREGRKETAEEIQRGIRNRAPMPQLNVLANQPATVPTSTPTSSASPPLPHTSHLVCQRTMAGNSPTSEQGVAHHRFYLTCTRKNHPDCRALRVLSCPLFEKLTGILVSNQGSNQTVSNFLAPLPSREGGKEKGRGKHLGEGADPLGVWMGGKGGGGC